MNSSEPLYEFQTDTLVNQAELIAKIEKQPQYIPECPYI